MTNNTANNESLKWAGLIYHPGKILIQHIESNWTEYKKLFIDQIAENVYNDIRRTRHLYSSPLNFSKEFSHLSENEKSYWYNYASEIPGKLRSLNLRIRQYKDFCRTCLIPYTDIEKLATADYLRECRKNKSDTKVPVNGNSLVNGAVLFKDLPAEQKRFFLEMNHLIPVELKKSGYEIIRPEEIGEISDKMVVKLARTIHSKYQRESGKKDHVSGRKSTISLIFSKGSGNEAETGDFENLPEDIRHSNLDNAFHIPTKLLAAGYKIRPVGKGFKPATLNLSEEEVETMARIEHLRWCWDKTLHGWFYGKVKDSRKKTHPSIISYDDLSEDEKEKDRDLVRLIPSLLKDISYEAIPIRPDKIFRLPYAIKPHGSLHRILEETSQMNTHIRNLVSITPEIEEMVRARNRKIEEAIREVQSSYNYALHIQETFLPDNLYVRECFPESFILFLPKDVVSGDFYFFSRQDNLIIFAAADCTGHGIPGALLSTIGYGILDQAVNEIRLTDPGKILHHLYSKIHRFLRHDPDGSGVRDDLDIILCILYTGTNELIYSGVRTPLYHVNKDGVSEYRTGNQPADSFEKENSMFLSSSVILGPGDTIYLCSDGYIDQFGGKAHKKYSSTRFRNFLQNVRGFPMLEQSDLLYEEIEKWRLENNEDQTDDILVIGIRI